MKAFKGDTRRLNYSPDATTELIHDTLSFPVHSGRPHIMEKDTRQVGA